jgi:orotidine-5'-phosphate decarboxylase
VPHGGHQRRGLSLLDKLAGAWARSGSMLCVGLDPDPARFPQPWQHQPEATFDFCRAIVDATADQVCAFKPQIAYFAATGTEDHLERLCGYITEVAPHVLLILDAKRGDIGPTAAMYAQEAFDRYQADAVTVNPYLGGDSVAPFLERQDRGAFFLCRTSNPGGGDLQNLLVDGRPLYTHVANMVASQWTAMGSCGLVVGATYPGELAAVRNIVGDLPLLVPGIGAQGGDVDAAVAAGMDRHGTGLVINSSRAILYASSGPDFAEAARAEAVRTREAISRAARAR